MSEFFIDLEGEYPERFTVSKFMDYVEDNFDPLTSNVLNSIYDLSPAGFIKVEGTDFRPDVLSFIIYEDTQYWWVLMLYNRFNSIDDIKNGMTIKYPDLADLEDLYFSLKINQGN